VLLALGCGWVAIATEQKAHGGVCNVQHMGNPRTPLAAPQLQPGAVIRRTCDWPVRTTWLVAPSVAMSLAIIVALGLALVAVSPRQASTLAYCWRRAVY
jgi:hypothetical protein